MRDCVELEIGLRAAGDGAFAVDVVGKAPKAAVQFTPPAQGPLTVRFPFDQLTAAALNSRQYGSLLAEALFENPAIFGAYSRARGMADMNGGALRLRLALDQSAAHLHQLRWETLLDPTTGNSLVAGQDCRFSRYVCSGDALPVPPRVKTDLRALVVVASPRDLGAYLPDDQPPLALDAAALVARAREALKPTPCAILADVEDAEGPPTLQALSARLNDGFDILYLVCHGTLVDGMPYLWLQDEGGATARIDATTLVQRLTSLTRRPRLVVLASCQSAGEGDAVVLRENAALMALGPRLGEAGIPAVLAMQGNVQVRTVQQFMPVLFRELKRDGQIDRAVAAARAAVSQEADWWAPVLYLRLEDASLWQAPAIVSQKFPKWPALVRAVRRGECTPILGPALDERLVGSWREIARGWAEQWGFPLAQHRREDLVEVAQYLAVTQRRRFLHDALVEYTRRRLTSLNGESNDSPASEPPLDRLIDAALRRLWESEPAEAHRLLAELPLSTYITVSPFDFLARALQAAGRTPSTVICHWRTMPDNAGSVGEPASENGAHGEHPLIYHLLGHLSARQSIVLTRDDFFDYLLGIAPDLTASDSEVLPPRVLRALVRNTRLLLGFRMDDPSFRVVLRIVNRLSRLRRQGGMDDEDDGPAHVAVQIAPNEAEAINPTGAMSYLEEYLEPSTTTIYWGSADEFLAELAHQLQTQP